MGKTGSGLSYPTIEDIANLNRKLIQQTGGNHDGAGYFLNKGSLEWVLDAIQYPLFGEIQYQTISEKAAILAWTIINGHVFIDGNKRTGILAMMIFLRKNGFFLSAPEDEIVDIAVKVAAARERAYTQEEFKEWTTNHLKLLMPPSY